MSAPSVPGVSKVPVGEEEGWRCLRGGWGGQTCCRNILGFGCVLALALRGSVRNVCPILCDFAVVSEVGDGIMYALGNDVCEEVL